MKPLTLVGIVLVALRIAGLIFQYVPIRETRTVVDGGPIQIQQETERRIAIPAIAGVVAVIAGLGLAVVGSAAAERARRLPARSSLRDEPIARISIASER